MRSTGFGVWLALILCPAWGAFATGCARGESAEERQLNSLREELARVQSDRDKFEARVNALELAAADRAEETRAGLGPGPTPSASTVPTPKLKVVHLSPDGSEATPDSTSAGGSADDPADDSPRPTLKATGTPEPRPRGRRAHDDGGGGAASLTPSDDNAGARPSALDPEAKKSYDAAVGLVSSRQYDRALEALSAFLVKWPDHPLADNAMYWRGECYFAKGEYERAIEQFEGQITRFPLGNKAPDALLKLGLSHQKLGHDDKARFYYDKLAREFPKSDVTRRIPSGFHNKETR